MSFINSSDLIFQQNGIDQMNVSSTHPNYPVNQAKSAANFMEVSESISNIDLNSSHIEMCFNSDKCFGDSFEFSANHLNCCAENALQFPPSDEQTFNNIDEFRYNYNEEVSEQQQQSSKFFIQPKFICITKMFGNAS